MGRWWRCVQHNPFSWSRTSTSARGQGELGYAVCVSYDARRPLAVLRQSAPFSCLACYWLQLPWMWALWVSRVDMALPSPGGTHGGGLAALYCWPGFESYAALECARHRLSLVIWIEACALWERRCPPWHVCLGHGRWFGYVGGAILVTLFVPPGGSALLWLARSVLEAAACGPWAISPFLVVPAIGYNHRGCGPPACMG